MAGNKLGMEVGEVRDLGKKMQSDADQLTSIIQQITTKLGQVFWQGPDAERFRNDWNGKHKNDLKQVAQKLDDAGKRAIDNAKQQDTTSA